MRRAGGFIWCRYVTFWCQKPKTCEWLKTRTYRWSLSFERVTEATNRDLKYGAGSLNGRTGSLCVGSVNRLVLLMSQWNRANSLCIIAFPSRFLSLVAAFFAVHPSYAVSVRDVGNSLCSPAFPDGCEQSYFLPTDDAFPFRYVILERQTDFLVRRERRIRRKS